jgi:hypothetical protein
MRLLLITNNASRIACSSQLETTSLSASSSKARALSPAAPRTPRSQRLVAPGHALGGGGEGALAQPLSPGSPQGDTAAGCRGAGSVGEGGCVCGRDVKWDGEGAAELQGLEGVGGGRGGRSRSGGGGGQVALDVALAAASTAARIAGRKLGKTASKVGREAEWVWPHCDSPSLSCVRMAEAGLVFCPEPQAHDKTMCVFCGIELAGVCVYRGSVCVCVCMCVCV